MTDQSLRRADELLSELVELVETARAVPMSSSCVLPRERVLDLLDELRETMPPEMDQARRLIATRDALLQNAEEAADQTRERAAAEAEALVTQAGENADRVTREAELRAHEILEAGRAEHARLVSATGVYQAGAEAAESVRAEANRYDADLRADAEQYARTTRAEAERYAARLTGDAEDYAETTLAELVSTLQRAAATADQGRAALAQRRAGEPGEPGEPGEAGEPGPDGPMDAADEPNSK
jgi:cell division septum initiation protein DivIVA